MAYYLFPEALGGFGADTVVPLANAGGTDVEAAEIETELTDTTVASEDSRMLFRLLVAGAQALGLDLRGNQLRVPDGSAAIPSVSFQGAVTTGIHYDTGNSGLAFDVGGTLEAIFGASIFWMQGALSRLVLGTASDVQVARIGPVGAMQLNATQGVVVGGLAALATTATGGFLEIPTCAGAPTGAYTPHTGKAALVYDSTNNRLYARFGGTWRSVVLA